jgi:hypothetical protein
MKYMLLITPAPMCGSASTASTRRSRSGPPPNGEHDPSGQRDRDRRAGGEPGGAPWTLRRVPDLGLKLIRVARVEFPGLRVYYDHRFKSTSPTSTRLDWLVTLGGPISPLVRRVFARVYGRNVDRAIPRLQEWFVHMTCRTGRRGEQG